MEQIKQKLLVYSSQPWFPVLIAGFCALDTFVPVVPNDFLIAAAVLAAPSTWIFCSICQTLGVTFGSLVFASITNPQCIKMNYPSIFGGSTWKTVESYTQSYGLFGTAVGSAILPIHPFLFLGILTESNIPLLVLSITMGRLVRNVAVCYLTSKTKMKIRAE